MSARQNIISDTISIHSWPSFPIENHHCSVLRKRVSEPVNFIGKGHCLEQHGPIEFSKMMKMF